MISKQESGKMDNTCSESTAVELIRLLRRINDGLSPQILRKEARKLIARVTSKDIARAEQNLINKGITAQVAGELSSIFVLLGILEQQGKSIKDQMPKNHILRRVFAEHELLRCFLVEFQELVEKINKMKTLSDTSSEFMQLSHIVEHFNAMDEHIEREEDVIFPFLKKHGWESLYKSSHNDHVYIKIATNDLIRLLGGYNPRKLKDFTITGKPFTFQSDTARFEHLKDAAAGAGR